MPQGLAPLEFIILLAFGLPLFLIPTIVAFIRNNHNKAAIAVINIFLGWTGIGWIVALIMAVSDPNPNRQNIVVTQSVVNNPKE